jgi:predicted flap endonuclease-1-like 5' DNA nuclease
MSVFACCFWWLVLGFLLGWLAHWLLARGLRRNSSAPSAAVVDENAARETAAAHHDAIVSAASAPPARVIDVSAARAAGFNLKHDDDLAIIEGIGPKLNELLHANGIKSFADLSRASVPELLEILERGGPHFQLANPGSWARQAALASENRWGELKRLQEELISGRPSGF